MRIDIYNKAELINKISDSEIEEMLKTIRPACQLRDMGLQEIDIEGVDRRSTAFLWSPKLIGKKFYLTPLATAEIPSFHTWGAPVYFKPSLAECLAAIRRYFPDWQCLKYFAVNTERAPVVMGMHHVSSIYLMSDIFCDESEDNDGE